MAFRVASVLILSCLLLQAQSQPPASDNTKESGSSEQANPAASLPEAPPIASCPAGGPIGAVDLSVSSPQRGDDPLPFRTIDHLSEGDTLKYAPILRGKEKRSGEIALVLVPAKRTAKEDPVVVTDPKPADKAQEWKIDQTISVAAFVYGPAGLSKKKVRNFLSQDHVLIAQLADYADKTAQAEALVAALSNAESSAASVNAALNGFASQYGFAVQLDRSQPVATQAETLFAAMNPQLASYNPMVSSTASQAGQTASLATAAATLFFGNPVGLAAGGTAMLLDLRAIAFPDTQFRSSFAQPLPKSAVNLCGQQGAAPPHTRVAFIWATRIPNAPTPAITVGNADYIPLTQKSPMPVDMAEVNWKYLSRARNWALVNDKNEKTIIPVVSLANQKAVELDLSKAKLAPGDYHLAGYWDWTPFQAKGDVHVLSLSDFAKAKLKDASQDHLVAKAGKIPVTLAGADFEFTTKVELKKLNDEFATAEPVRFLLPKGLREGPQDHMDVQIDTHDLEPGAYELLISQQDGKSHPVDFKILSNPPKIDNLPILANQGVATQHYVLKGERLSQLTRLEAPGASLDLSAPSGDGNERAITVQFKSSPQPGTSLPVTAYVEDRSEPMKFSDALQITGPLPVIASSKLSLPAGLGITPNKDEFPAGNTLTAMLDVKNMSRTSTLKLACDDDQGDATTLRVGHQTANWNLQQLSPDQLFLSYDTSNLPAGCALEAVIDNGRNGRSQPFILARIVRMPQIASFALTNDPPQNGSHTYLFTGQNLEMIEKAGWDATNGTDVAGLPTPVPGPGQTQSLRVTLPDPQNPQAGLFVWLRGDWQGRATVIKAPALPKAPNTPAAAPTPVPGPAQTSATLPH